MGMAGSSTVWLPDEWGTYRPVEVKGKPDTKGPTIGMVGCRIRRKGSTNPFDWTPWRYSFNNVTLEGREHAMNLIFKGGTQIVEANWRIGIIEDANTPTEQDETDTAAKITLTSNPPTTNDWQEMDDWSAPTARQAWGQGTVSTSAGNTDLTNATALSHTANATATAWGAFLIGSAIATWGDTTGTLYATDAFAATQPLTTSDVLDVTWTLRFTTVAF